jgi:amidase
MDELCFRPIRELQLLIRSGELSARELVAACLAQIHKVNPKVNAVVTLDEEGALDRALAADERQASGERLPLLHGIPVAHKDLVETAGMRTTYGSPIYRDHIPKADALLVKRWRAAGAISIGKTNTPEFGAGSQTFNDVFGATYNPFDLSRTCGGSSGGAAVGLACGMFPLADGSDTGGSLRNPAAFCNVVGLRPSAGRVPDWPNDTAWFTLSVSGPMARTVDDVALGLAAIAGPDSRCPISLDEPGASFAEPNAICADGVRVAVSTDFGGLPVQPEVVEVIEQSAEQLANLGFQVDDACPDLRDADEVFKTLRAWKFELKFAQLIKKHPNMIKDTIVWNAQEGEKISGPQLARMEVKRTRLFHRTRQFFENYDFLIGPVTQVLPFSVDQPFVNQINDVVLETYIDWMKSCYLISATGLPAISVPGGFSRQGLPVGLQIIGGPRNDLGVLQMAKSWEQATQFGRRRPPVAAS